MIVEKIEVERTVNIPDPGIIYRLPSGFSNMEIEVCEDPFGMEAKYVPKKKAENET